jgi:hypothetical protein
MEGDQEIFKAILESLIMDFVTEVFKKQHLDVDGTFENFDDEELLAMVIIARNQ